MELRLREAVRGIIVDDDEQVLLVKYVFPSGAERWGTPGGGLDPGETHEEGLRRELYEELGLRDVTIGPHVWNRVHIFPMISGHDGQRDRFYHVPVDDRFEPQPSLSWDQLRAERLHEIRWWTVDEIEAATDVWFAPQRMGELLRALVDVGPPDEPVETGI